jgi:hypothetical protein
MLKDVRVTLYGDPLPGRKGDEISDLSFVLGSEYNMADGMKFL